MNPEPDEDLKSTAAVRQITDEDIVYSTLLESHPILESLMDRFDLCSVQTGDRFMKTVERMAVKPNRPILTSEEYSKFIKIIDRILNSEENCAKHEIKEAKKRKTRRSKKKTANEFKQMVRAMVIPAGSLADPNYFKDSTLRGNLLR